MLVRIEAGELMQGRENAKLTEEGYRSPFRNGLPTSDIHLPVPPPAAERYEQPIPRRGDLSLIPVGPPDSVRLTGRSRGHDFKSREAIQLWRRSDLLLEDGFGEERQALENRFLLQILGGDAGPGEGSAVIGNVTRARREPAQAAQAELCQLQGRFPLLDPATARSAVQIPQVEY